MKNKDFEKARNRSLGWGFIGLLLGLILLGGTYDLYRVGVDSFICLTLGILGIGLFIISFNSIFDYVHSGTNPERYTLCKRCKCLIKKDKGFCSDCKNSIRISIKRDKDKKYFSEYKTLIKKEEKNK